jgi:hypothetical protein
LELVDYGRTKRPTMPLTSHLRASVRSTVSA